MTPKAALERPDPPAGYTLRAQLRRGVRISRAGSPAGRDFVVKAFVAGEEKEHIAVGIYRFSPAGNLECEWITVLEDHQRHGLASAMHVEAERLSGQIIHPAKHETVEGRALWTKPDRLFGRGIRPSRRKILVDDYIPPSNEGLILDAE